MCTALSSQPNLDDIKKEARRLLHALQRRDAAALRRYYSIDCLDGLAQPRLDDAQYIIARERGFGSWQKLREHLPNRSHGTLSLWKVRSPMCHARGPVAAAAPQCNTCGSVRLNKLRAELGLHFNGLQNIDKPVLWTFRDVMVCTDCGEADLHVPPHELQWWEQDAQRIQTRVIFVDPIIAQTCRACGSTELRMYSSELALHARGRGNLDKHAPILFPQVPVCRDCRAARFTVPVSELHPWLNELASPVKAGL